MKKFFYFFSLILLLTPFYSFSQGITIPQGIEEQVNIETIPSIPKPGELVNASVSVYSTDLNSSNISWQINGKTIESGIGKKTFQFKAPDVGEKYTLTVVISKNNGQTITESKILSIGDVELFYEANTYVPPFYKGAKLFTNESTATFYAVANLINSSGTKINPDNLIYTWKVDNYVVNDASGYGKKTFVYNGGIIQRNQEVLVEVTDSTGSIKAKDSIQIDDITPEILFYEYNPIYGLIFSKAITGQFNLNRPEVEIAAFPMFFDTTKPALGDVGYVWSMNSRDIDSPIYDNRLIIRNESEESGFARIGLEATHKDNVLQTVFENFGIYFNTNQNNNSNF